MNSVWAETVAKPNFPTLQGDITTDVLIIGGGLEIYENTFVSKVDGNMRKKL